MASLNGPPCRKRQPFLSTTTESVVFEAWFQRSAAMQRSISSHVSTFCSCVSCHNSSTTTGTPASFPLENFLPTFFGLSSLLVSALCSYESFIGELWTLWSRLENEEQFVFDNFIARSEIDPMTVVEIFYENYTNVLTMAFWHTISLIPNGSLIQDLGP